MDRVIIYKFFNSHKAEFNQTKSFRVAKKRAKNLSEFHNSSIGIELSPLLAEDCRDNFWLVYNNLIVTSRILSSTTKIKRREMINKYSSCLSPQSASKIKI